MSGSGVWLFRAVRPRELASITLLGRFTNPFGLETKYFATSREGAEAFARLAQAAYQDGPYVIVRTEIAPDLIVELFRVEVDGGIEAIVLPTQYLDALAPPVLEGPVDEAS